MAASESQNRRLFSEILAQPDADVDLAHAALLIACEEYPDLDVGGYLARMDEMGRAVARHAHADPGPQGALRALHRHLFEEQGFHGNDTDYYDPRNSFLNDVLERRTGIPITLSLVYMEVARRIGLHLEGVGLPGHFIVRVLTPGGDQLVDPFHAGALLTETDCQERLDRIFGGTVKVDGPMLAPCSRKQILARLLRNLKAIFMKNDAHNRALGVVELLLHIDPRSGEDVRDRGLLHAALDCYARAAQDLEQYLGLVPGTPEAPELRDKIGELRQRAARLN